ncbi:cytochrome C oxidase assembly protein [Methylosinus sp. R-45379]|uniref:cytochrome c oxidase assembly protein n=1 Tax=unclassified Methylosinus TaxID=2624500 RepID=UPI0004633EA5|nr:MULTISPECIES: cytochrome c oxidase assembly protein [unclassified Methylosinus]OAI31357.1 cytochrome C oxidase assembly protein [Methylosinus sp. R-45379]
MGADHKERGHAGRGALLLIGGSVAMLILSFASVPLYRAFCSATGFGGTTQVAKLAPAKPGERSIGVRFDANVARDLPWRFEPETPRIVVRTGETATIYYKVVNLSDQETSGVAAYNVSPDQAGAYFDKLACFCFSEQKLAPHESAEWPVVFFLDPALEADETMRHVEEITLSYSFFASKKPKEAKPKEAASGVKPKT